MSDELPPLMNIGKAAKAFGVDRSTVSKWIFAGDLRVVKLGARTWVPRAEVDRILAARGDQR